MVGLNDKYALKLTQLRTNWGECKHILKYPAKFLLKIIHSANSAIASQAIKAIPVSSAFSSTSKVEV